MTKLYDQALEFATKKHQGQTRQGGEPYVNHVTRVAQTVKTLGSPEHVTIAALLHDTLEDTDTTTEELKEKFGPVTTSLVIELTNVFPSKSGGSRAERKAKEHARLATTSAEAQTIKVADLMDNHARAGEFGSDFARLYRKEKEDLLVLLTRADPKILKQAKDQINAQPTL